VVENNTAVLQKKIKRDPSGTASIADLFLDTKMRTSMIPSSLFYFLAREKGEGQKSITI